MLGNKFYRMISLSLERVLHVELSRAAKRSHTEHVSALMI